MRNPYRLLQSTQNATCKNILIFRRKFGTCAYNRVSGNLNRRPTIWKKNDQLTERENQADTQT